MHDIAVAVVVAVVQGLTEFLPVSSTGHMILAGSLLGFQGEAATVFEVFIQLGSMVAVLILYRARFARMLTGDSLRGRVGMSIWHVAAAILPVMAVGFLAHRAIKHYLFGWPTVLFGLVIGGLIMLLAEKLNRRPQITDLEGISVGRAFFIGLFQIMSLWPGFSRSGSTIAGGLFMGLERRVAAEFSFIIAVPVMFIACFYDLLKSWEILTVNDIIQIALGFLVAFAVAYLSIVWFMRFLGRQTLASFAYYRIALAIVAWFYFSHFG
ncbi:MAG: undecaprenyl-diphosphate phosphatase [Negativicutes bacterium]|nr:undecaprenyl-diphosphate phosphatase [Negativicutes bacterium]